MIHFEVDDMETFTAAEVRAEYDLIESRKINKNWIVSLWFIRTRVI
jgi:hypothetical protein